MVSLLEKFGDLLESLAELLKSLGELLEALVELLESSAGRTSSPCWRRAFRAAPLQMSEHLSHLEVLAELLESNPDCWWRKILNLEYRSKVSFGKPGFGDLKISLMLVV
jgi:hypothetical protein